MKVFRSILTLSLALCVGALWAQPIRIPQTVPADKVLTLQDCINLALNNDASIKQAQSQIVSGGGAVQRAQANLLPTTSVSSNTLVGSNRNNKNTNLSFGASQLLFDFGKSPAGLSQAKYLKNSSEQNLTGTTSDVVLNVKQTYYSYLQTSHLVDVFTENLKSQSEHVAEAQARKDVGVAPQSDVLTAQAAAASAKFDLVTAQNNADQARVSLNSAMGIDINAPIKITDSTEPEIPVPSETDAIHQAYNNRPELRSQDYVISAAQAGVKVAETGNLPTVAATYNNNQTLNGGVSSSPNAWTVGVGVRWTPFDSGATQGSITEAKAQVVSDQETLYSLRQSVSQDVIKSRLSLISAIEQLQSAQAEVASATENLAAARGRYEAQVGIFLEVIDAQSALLKAQTDELSARYGLSIARASLEHAIGGSAAAGGK